MLKIDTQNQPMGLFVSLIDIIKSVLKKAVVSIFLFLGVFVSFGQEICDNALDDDADGLIDLNDPDCECEGLIELSVVPNPSFEDTLCCPTTEAMLSCADTWVQASTATSDFFHTCDFSEIDFDDAVPPVMPLPGGGEGFVGIYNFLSGYREYIGACLGTPLLAGESYSINFHTAYAYGDVEDLEIHLYGTPVCSDLPWVGNTCPAGIGSWELLGAEIVNYTLDGDWKSITITFVPTVDINAVAFGATCGPLDSSSDSYFYFDELILTETIELGFISEEGGWCSEDLILTGNVDATGGTWQWYKDGIALIGETGATLEPFPYGEGEFTAVYSLPGGACRTMTYRSPIIPEANFTAENVCFGQQVTFNNLSLVDGEAPDDWIWHFGDGETSTAFNPTHLYFVPDLYPAELVVFSNDSSCFDTARVDVTVFARPDADFDITGTGVSEIGDWQACANSPLQFNDLTTIDGPVSFASWEWDFGDSTISFEQNPIHAYSDTGEYQIKLIVVSENGCVDSIEQTIRIAWLNADFDAEAVCLSSESIFTDNSVDIGGGGITSWTWDFDDESGGSTEESPTHLYSEADIYEVKLIVTNAMGCVDSAIKTVEVEAFPSPNFFANHNPTDYFNTDLVLTIIYPNATSTYSWLMPGGTPGFAFGQGPINVSYPEFVRGNYEVTLIETTDLGCTDSVTHIISVLEDEFVYAPNVFTPNSDPFNQTWRVYVEGFDLNEFHLMVFNRWGEILWETYDPNESWDGTYVDGVLVQTGTYVWRIKTRDQITDEVLEYHGFVTVLK